MTDTTLSESLLFGHLPVAAFNLAKSVHAGFPSPAADFGAKCIDVLDRMVAHPQARASRWEHSGSKSSGCRRAPAWWP